MRNADELQRTLVGRILREFIIVDHYLEHIRTDGAEQACANRKPHSHLRRECTKHKSLGHVDGCDRHIDGFLGEHIGIDRQANRAWNHLQSTNLAKTNRRMDGVLQVAHIERFYLHILHLVELILVGIDRHLGWQEVGMGKIVALAGCHLSLEDNGHLLGRAIGEVEIILARLYGEQLAGAIKL